MYTCIYVCILAYVHKYAMEWSVRCATAVAAPARSSLALHSMCVSTYIFNIYNYIYRHVNSYVYLCVRVSS